MTLKRIRFTVEMEFEAREAAPDFPPRETHVEQSKWEQAGKAAVAVLPYLLTTIRHLS